MKFIPLRRLLPVLVLAAALFPFPLGAEAARERNARQTRYEPDTETGGRAAALPETPLPGDAVPLPPAPEFPADSADPVQVSAPPAPPAAQNGPRFALIPERLRPGEPVTVAYADDFDGPGSRDFYAVLINGQGRRLLRAPLFSFTLTADGKEVKAAVLAVPSTAGSGAFLVRVEAGNRIIRDLPLVVEGREFVSEVIDLDERNTAIRTESDAQKTAESEALWAILSRSGTEIFEMGPFAAPVGSTRRTSFYGDRRVFRYVDGSSDTSIHGGVDYGVPSGTEVRACAAGRVVMARFRIVTGHSVVVEHLPGLYSLYYHLEKIEVAEGGRVERGALLGYSGSTGLSTGPHLHWEIRAAGENADPDAFTARAVLDKDAILGNLNIY